MNIVEKKNIVGQVQGSTKMLPDAGDRVYNLV